MKERTDFVSNSSSCSFVIKESINVRIALDIFVDLGEIPWDLSDKFSIQIHYKHKDFKDIKKYLLDEYEEGGWTDSSHIDDDTDTISYISDINCFVNRFKDTPIEVRMKVTEIGITCDHSESYAVSVLNMLFDLFEKKGLKPSDKYSEVEFRPGKGQEATFLVNLGKMLKG